MSQQLKDLISIHSMQRTQLVLLEGLIDEAYSETLPFKEGDTITYEGIRGVVSEITYFSPIKIIPYKKDGSLSMQYRYCREVEKIIIESK